MIAPLIPPSFDYAAPKTLAEAIDLLKGGGGEAKVIAGGQSLVPLLKLRLASPKLLVDINRIPGLDYIGESEGFLRLGALTRMAEVASSDLLRNRYPIIHDASRVIADPLVRNLGTVGGNISHGDPANDLPAVMLALNAEFEAIGPSGRRTIRAQDFFLDSFTVALHHDELLTEVKVPVPPPRSRGSYQKLEQKVADFATAAVAVQLSLNHRGECESLGIGLTAVGPTAIRARDAEEALKGKKPTDRGAVEMVAVLAAQASDPASDMRGTVEYKKKAVERLVGRALKIAYQRSRSRGAR
ncbi:MAG TPA: xanthine dehydrogenase family protein subunit M [Nitrososphaerales archaeon]|nr:xanthine dehydrogenase family protein subunit M [Nitrososphaerales archaeon]